jgi:hypothetical protein
MLSAVNIAQKSIQNKESSLLKKLTCEMCGGTDLIAWLQT